MTAPHGFISAGSWTLDRIKLIENWPPEETLTRIFGTDKQGGGSAHNLGMDIRQLDPLMPVDGIGLLGTDADGDYLFDNATQVGIDTRQLRQASLAETSYTDVMSVIGSGKRTFFHQPGISDLISPDDFDFANSSRKILHLGMLGVHKKLDDPWQDDPCGWVTVLKKAKAAGLQTNIELISIDAERIRQIGLPCLHWLDTLIVNDEEIGALTRIQTIENGKANPARCQEAALAALALGSMTVVVVHFPAGAVCVTSDGKIETSASVVVKQEDIGSSVGAGDAFAAGILYALHEQWPLSNALQLAHSVAAASLRSQTTVGSVENIDTCLALAGYTRPDI